MPCHVAGEAGGGGAVSLRRVYLKHLDRNAVLGRRVPVRPPRLKLGDYLKDAVAPATCDWSKPAYTALTDVYMNDRLGDCVIAAAYHGLAVASGNAGRLFTATNQQILADYEAIGEYNPNDPNSDQGCDEKTALEYYAKHGFADGTKLSGWVSVDPANQNEIRQAIYLFENLLFGVGLPDAWLSPPPSANGFVWDVAAGNNDNGHAFEGVGYTPLGVQIDTWGLIGSITWRAVAELASLYVWLTPDIISKATDKSPLGFDYKTLQADFAALPKPSLCSMVKGLF